MAPMNPLSKREEEVARLLVQGKSNKQIALALGISEHTVEFHLKNIYAKLQVSSGKEAISKLIELWKSLGDPQAETLRESAVESREEKAHNKDSATLSLKSFGKRLRSYPLLVLVGLFIGVILAGVVLAVVSSGQMSWVGYERECEYPDIATVGQVISRSTASAMMVHGQLGCAGVYPWLATPGYVQYNNIRTPAIDTLYLNLRYSKNSPAAVPLTVYLDNEPNPRNTIYPADQQNWDQFTWTGPIFLGAVTSGIHSIKFSTDGQQYGVVDLDKFVLTAKSP